MIINKEQIELEGKNEYAKWREKQTILNREKAAVELPPLIDSNFDFIPAPAKAFVIDFLLNSVIPGHMQDHITWGNGFFEQSDLDYIKKVALKTAKKHGNTKGSVGYTDYDEGYKGTHWKGGGPTGVAKILDEPEHRVKMTLGKYGYRIDEKAGMLYVSDRFNFNDAPKDQDKSLAQREVDFKKDKKESGISATKDTQGTLRKLGKHYGSAEGSGMKFELEIPLGD